MEKGEERERGENGDGKGERKMSSRIKNKERGEEEDRAKEEEARSCRMRRNR